MDLLLVMMLLAVGAMFLLSSRTRKQQRQATAFRSTLDVGDEVMTGSGLFGTVVSVDGDVITLESPSGGRTDWLRGAIAKLATPPWAEAEADGDYEEPEGDEEYADEDQYADAENSLTDVATDDSYEVEAPERSNPAPGDSPRATADDSTDERRRP